MVIAIDKTKEVKMITETATVTVKKGDYTSETVVLTLKELKKQLSQVRKSQRYFYLDNLFNNKKITEEQYDWLLG